MTEHIVRTLTCDHCGHEARCGKPMLRLATVALATAYVCTPAGALDLHACSQKCAVALLPRFDEGPCPLCDHDEEATKATPAKATKKRAKKK